MTAFSTKLLKNLNMNAIELIFASWECSLGLITRHCQEHKTDEMEHIVEHRIFRNLEDFADYILRYRRLVKCFTNHCNRFLFEIPAQPLQVPTINSNNEL